MRKMTTKTKASLLYTTAILFVIGWWSWGLYQPETPPPQRVSAPLLPERQELKQALQGDFSLMAVLIGKWQTLDRQEQLLASLISENLSSEMCPSNGVTDDLGQHLPTTHPYRRLLPQTYMAATILFALCPEEIIAIPSGFRTQEHLYPPETIGAVALNLDTFFAEKLAQEQPEIAFVANYSNPTTIETLKEHHVPLYTTIHTDTPTAIDTTIRNIGDLVGKSLQAELMVLFLKAALKHIDNSLEHHFLTHTYPKLLLAYDHRTLTLPDKGTLQDHLLTRLKINTNQPRGITLNKEKIDTDCLLLCTHTTPLILNSIDQDPFFRQIPYRLIEDEIMNSPTQFYVLAYYDLAQILMEVS
ncbi:MAG: ABC transporter substrate-binding protein [Chlamydiia bacterium]|nr:ABC transporter substrate-binding protein [Chlamydiia bacterium]